MFMDSLSSLHACGLRILSLEGNDMSGSLTPEWGTFTNLTQLILSEWQGRGVKPAGLHLNLPG
jgi:hypothetical protein